MKKVILFIKNLFVRTPKPTNKPTSVVKEETIHDENIDRLIDLQEKPSVPTDFEPVYDFQITNVERVFDAMVKMNIKGISPLTSAMIYSELDASISILSVRKCLYKLSVKNRIKEAKTENPDKSRTKYWLVN
jgi:hypothetical protein